MTLEDVIRGAFRRNGLDSDLLTHDVAAAVRAYCAEREDEAVQAFGHEWESRYGEWAQRDAVAHPDHPLDWDESHVRQDCTRAAFAAADRARGLREAEK